MNSEDFNVLPRNMAAESVDSPANDLTFDDLWDDRSAEITADNEPAGELASSPDTQALRAEIQGLEIQKKSLEAEVSALKAEKERLMSEEVTDIKAHIERMIGEGVKDLDQRKQALEISIEQLERRKERVRQEMRTSFAGVSQDLAIRVQGFKDYLVGSLQDLAAAAEQLELSRFEAEESPRPSIAPETSSPRSYRPPEAASRPTRPPSEPRAYREEASRSSRPPADLQSARSSLPKQGFPDQSQKIQALLDRYRTRPDYYGPPWQLRRTFEPIHAERVQQWFFKQGGRGAIRGMGSRLQNILVASAVISLLVELQGDRFRSLVLANSPERLGEWRRGLQDCLGISRADFGPDRGVVLFESPEALIQKADRLIEEGLSPLIIIDDTEERLNFALLQFPYWLAFAPEPQQSSSYWY
jgi:hypothetical protein